MGEVHVDGTFLAFLGAEGAAGGPLWYLACSLDRLCGYCK